MNGSGIYHVRSCAFLGGRSLLKCRLELFPPALESSLSNARVCPEQLEEVLECIETKCLGACRNTLTLDPGPAKVSIADLVCDRVEGLSTPFPEDLPAYVVFVVHQQDDFGAFEMDERRKAGLTLLSMLGEVVHDGLRTGVALLSDDPGHTGF